MLCRTARRILFLYGPGELSQAEILRLERHIARCPECAAENIAARRTGRVVAALREHGPVLDDPEGLTAAIMRGVESERQRSWSARPRTRMPSTAFRRIQLVCSLVLLLIVSSFVAQTYSDATKVYALEQRLYGERGARPLSAGALPGQVRAEVSSAPDLLRFIQWIDNSNDGSHHTLMDHIAKNYPGLASLDLDDGVDERERAILATEGETLLKELASIVRTGGENHAK